MSSNRLDIKHIYTLTELSNFMSYRVVSDYRIVLKIEIKWYIMNLTSQLEFDQILNSICSK